MQDSYFKWEQEGHKFGYTPLEIFFMVLITSITNFSSIPSLALLYQNRLAFQLITGIFTLLTSFMYHFSESIGASVILMSVYEWHKLDNIGAIISYINILVYLANLKDAQLEQKIQYFSLFIVIVLQEIDPWNLWFTLTPIIGFGFLVIFFKLYYGTNSFQNTLMTRYSGIMMVFAIFFFIKSQDENNDYLRFNHGMWHLFIGYQAVYSYQINEKSGTEKQLADLFQKKVDCQKIKYKKINNLETNI